MRKWEEARIQYLAAMLLSALLTGCGTLPAGVLPDTTDSLTESLQTPTADPSSLDAATAPIPADDCLALGQPSDEMHKDMFDALNAFRVANGLPELVYSRRLEAAADAHVRDLYERNFFAHINPGGDNPGQRALKAGFCHEYVGENIAAGQKSVEAAQRAWEDSPSHRENMLEPQYYYAGVGFYQDPTGRMYWAQEMAYKLD